jgi:hypothetical protein
MNSKRIFLTVTAATALLISGCSKESNPGANESAPASAASVTNVSNLSTTTVVKAVSANSEAPVQALAAITNTVAATNVATTNATAAVNGAQSVLSNAMALIAQKKYTEAGTALASLKDQNPSGSAKLPDGQNRQRRHESAGRSSRQITVWPGGPQCVHACPFPRVLMPRIALSRRLL